MRVVQLATPGGLENLQVVDREEAGAPAAGEILVRVRASSLNYHDYAVVAGMIPTADKRIPMSDGAGVVEAVGEGVAEFAVGDEVVSCFFPAWHDGAATIGDFSTTPGDGVDGYARERVVRPASWFTHAPKGYTPAQAATLTTAGMTRWTASTVASRRTSVSACASDVPRARQIPTVLNMPCYLQEKREEDKMIE